MSICPWLALVGLVVCAAPAGAAPQRAARGHKAAPPPIEQLEQGAVVDWEMGTLEAPGSSAADLRAPSAEVARVKAERLARERARERMKKALAALPRARLAGKPPPEAEVDAALAKAEAVAVEYGVNGSVSLRLRLKLAALPVSPLPPPGIARRYPQASRQPGPQGPPTPEGRPDADAGAGAGDVAGDVNRGEKQP